jgi:hypothetical protein
MKKHITSLALGLTFAGAAFAQVPPAKTVVVLTPVAAAPTAAVVAVPPAVAARVNPFNGKSKVDESGERELGALQMQALISTQKLKLQQDELSALKIEADKRKVLDVMNPPAVVKPKAAPVVKKKKKEVAPIEIVAISPERNASPEVVGVVESGGRRVALVLHDGRSIRAQEGSIIGGRSVGKITNTSLQWGTEFLNVSSRQGPPMVVVTDEGKPKVQNTAQQPAVYAPSVVVPNASTAPRVMPVLNPVGANISSAGASNPSGVFGMPLPPPPIVGLR